MISEYNSSVGLNVTNFGSTLNLNSGQIRFPATQNASSNANTLDDYERGTFTPGVTFGGGNTGLTYTFQAGRYTKIGNTVYYQVGIDINSKGSSTGHMRITNLPFNSANVSYGSFACSAWTFNFTGLTGAISPAVLENTNEIVLYQSDATGDGTQVTDANVSSGYIQVSGFYFVSI